MLKITKKGNKAWVTFTAPVEEDVLLVGEWNDWEPEEMKVKKSGERYLTKVLATGRTYQFGYQTKACWYKDDETECVASPFGSENSLLAL